MEAYEDTLEQIQMLIKSNWYGVFDLQHLAYADYEC
jgi:hypothetical protein